MRFRSGTKQAGKGKVLVRTATTEGMRQIRCPGCKKMVSPRLAPNGKKNYTCICGRTFSPVAM